MGLSVKLTYLVARNVVVICHKKNIDLDNLIPQQLDDIYILVIDRVIEVFKTNGFRIISHSFCNALLDFVKVRVFMCLSLRLSSITYLIFIKLNSYGKYLNFKTKTHSNNATR